jgi:hypothetical protein
MADTITLATLKTRTRQRSDMENSSFVSDSELVSYINSSYAQLYDILVSRFEDYYTTSSTSTVASGANTIAVPADFYKLRGLDYELSTDNFTTITKYNFQNRNKGRRGGYLTYSDSQPRQYRIIGNNLEILPKDNAQGTYKLWYVPRLTRLSDDTDTLDAVNGWEEYIVIDAAIKMLAKEESDISALLIEKRAMEERIEAMANDRDSEPETITDANPNAWWSTDLSWDW